jgi:hypothetical protein
MKGKKSLAGDAFYRGRRERDGIELGPHVGDGEPTTGESAEPWHGTSSHVPSLSRAARSVFKHRPVPLFHRAGPNSLTPLFFYFSS